MQNECVTSSLDKKLLLSLDEQMCFALYSASLAMTKIYKPLLAQFGQRKVTEAYLNARLNPTLENNVNARIVLANTTYEVAVEMCDSKSEKQACINAANLIKDKSIANARAFTNPSDL